MKQDRPIKFDLIMVGLNMVCYISLWLNLGKGINWKLSGQLKERQKQKRGDYIESLLDNNDVNFWKQWKKVKKNLQNVITVNSNIQLANGLLNNCSKKCVDSKESTDLFKEFMYNYDPKGKKYDNDNDKVLMHFSIEEIDKEVNDLNLRRAGDRNDLSIERVIYAYPIIYHRLCALFVIIIKHGHVPDDFKHGVIIPVIKAIEKGLEMLITIDLLLLYLFF